MMRCLHVQHRAARKTAITRAVRRLAAAAHDAGECGAKAPALLQLVKRPLHACGVGRAMDDDDVAKRHDHCPARQGIVRIPVAGATGRFAFCPPRREVGDGGRIARQISSNYCVHCALQFPVVGKG